MATKKRMTCQKCGRVIPETNFFKKKDGTRFDYCKIV
jgi:Pyruvate/2-oxoacid:ferredoxin oxidoreductase delta subunit